MSSYFVAQAGLELAMFLLQPPKGCDYRFVPLNLAQIQFLNFLFLFLCINVHILFLL